MRRYKNNFLLFLIISFLVVAPSCMYSSTHYKDNEITFLSVGDIMLARDVEQRSLYKKDPLHSFSRMAELLAKMDFNFGNLEGAMTGYKDINPGHFVLNAPLWMMDGIIKYKFIVNTANNHILDQGEVGMMQTLNNLNKNKIKTIGTGVDLKKAWSPTIILIKGIKIAFVGASFTSYNFHPEKYSNCVARIQQINDLTYAVKKSKKAADFVIVTMHAGKEYTKTPQAEQIAFAHAAINSGADMVIGAHPHWIQSIEKYKGKYIFYSLGNFIFDQEWSQETQQGLTLKTVLKIQDPKKFGSK